MGVVDLPQIHIQVAGVNLGEMIFLETVGNSDLIPPADHIVVAHLGHRLLAVDEPGRVIQKVQSAVPSQQHDGSARAKRLSYIHDRQIVDSRSIAVGAIGESTAESASSEAQATTRSPQAT